MEIKKPNNTLKIKSLDGYAGGLPTEMITLINSLIEAEAFSSQTYLQMAAWCDPQGYTGSAKFFRKHAEEERGHMLKLYDFLADKNIVAVTPTIQAPQQTFVDLVDLLNFALEREFHTTALYEDASERALNLPCHQSYQLFQWYIKEQVEEESLYQTLVDKANILMKGGGMTGLALIELDGILEDLV